MKKLLHKIMTFRQRKGILRSPKSRHRQGLTSGFTLIELLVAALIASLMVAVMLGFLVGVLDSDRKETVKTNAQEELQAAISYIADDMQEAIYVYGAEGLLAINSQLPHMQTTSPSTECNQTSNTCTPILVFWKRFTFDPNSTATYSSPTATPTTEIIGCMPYVNNPAATPPASLTELNDCRASATTRAYGRDTYTYALVAYYLKNDDPTIANNSTSGWSQTARILRWEIRDGYVAYCAKGGTIGSTGCPASAQATTRLPSNTSTLITVPIPLVDPNQYFVSPSVGFNRPDFSTAGGLTSWKKFADFNFTTSPFVSLVDFMDDTEYVSTGFYNQGGNSVATGTGAIATASATSALKIPIGKNDTSTPNKNLDCDDPSIGVGTTDPANNFTQRVPADFSSWGVGGSNPSRLSSFYACVSPNTVTARIFMRGNALARLTTPATAKARRIPELGSISFFPTADVRSFGRSQIGLGK
ncbi:prepilin-type N-terminal cleavage/methylation domain-containing protein [Pseudanabaena sp. UWO311]|uniref:prepilin-type N-terminal cleavage/methylation domain-containing protein n=1 Tax=Pseudanabaena sp. UWO311 TaxID=2487337 RepID=UPI00115BD1D5|nr:prepilin-type N-terminal cleavage/methylation domain-containing protein [Pseudanabaena sp. UWO311]TYQ27159.1 prepilin-type N-terminal cleavage/methylation domain-containing protein [Pseudanabaena sp. UWO311]